jgi:adenylosuccinate synthase
MVINPFSFLEELETLTERGIAVEGRLYISSSAQVVMPYHIIIDNINESELNEKSIGSTGKGIGPAYSDKHSRRGMRMGDFLRSKEELHNFVNEKVEYANRYLELYNAPALSPRKVAADFVNIKGQIAPMIKDTPLMISRMNSSGKRIMLEGAQGTLLDIDHGTYPFVTSSTCTVGGAVSGSGMSLSAVERTIGIFKAYTTRVGNGPFPTELEDRYGEYMRNKGNEYGTTTGRPRRCGWFDIVAAKYSSSLNDLNEIALTKLDVLSGIPKVKICVAYELDGERIEDFPSNHHTLKNCLPVYEEMDGWAEEELSSDYDSLPDNARRYVERIESELGVAASFISTGPARKETIIRDKQAVMDR